MIRCYARLFTFFIMTNVMVIARNCECKEIGNPSRPDILNDIEPIESNPSERPAHKRKKCCPYNFDGKMCKVVGNRVLCGYNRNVGMPNNDDIRDLKNGCRLRGSRLECGYDEGPFTNPPRPPVWDSNEIIQDNVQDVTDDEPIPERLVDVSPITIPPTYATTTCQTVQQKIVCRRTLN